MEPKPFGDGWESQIGPWTVEWCSWGEQKGTFHVGFLSQVIRHNTDVFLGTKKAEHISPWLVLGIFPTGRQASEFIAKLRAQQNAEE